MIRYPIEFSSQTQAKDGTDSSWISQAKHGQSQISIPPEFMGPGQGLSPEDLFNQALTNCFIASFKVYAQNSNLKFKEIHVESKLVVDLDEHQSPVMKDLFLDVKILSPSHPEKALHLAKRASELGFILNSVKTIRHFNFEIV